MTADPHTHNDRPSAALSASWATVAAFSLPYFVVTCWLAARKQLWTDELYVYNLVSLPTLGTLWRSLADRPDAMPPFIHIAAFAISKVIGLGPLAVRFPAVLGFWLCSVAIFAFLRRRVSLPLAAVGMLLPLTVPFAYDYASEARGYGPMLGFCAAAVFFWDITVGKHRRALALVGLGLSLALALASHLFAVLLLVPLAAAETSRSWLNRRIDWAVWVALAASGLIVVPLWSTLPNVERIGRMTSAPHGPGLLELGTAWGPLLSTPLTYLGIAAVLAFSLQWGRETRAGLAGRVSHPVPLTSDWVLACGLILLPLVGFLATHVAMGLLVARYLLPTVIGFSVAVPLACSAVQSRGRALVLVAWVAASALVSVAQVKQQMAETGDVALGRGIFALLAHADEVPKDGLPIVVSDYHAFMALRHYAVPVLKDRLVFCPDYETWIASGPGSQLPLFGGPMPALESFVQMHGAFYLYDCDTEGHVSPVLPALVRMGMRLTTTSATDTRNTFPRPGYLFLVTRAPAVHPALDR